MTESQIAKRLVVMSAKTGADNSRSEAIVLQLEEVFILISLSEES